MIFLFIFHYCDNDSPLIKKYIFYLNILRHITTYCNREIKFHTAKLSLVASASTYSDH